MLQCTDIKKQPTANIIDGNVQLHILSLIPDNFQGVTEIVSDIRIISLQAKPLVNRVQTSLI